MEYIEGRRQRSLPVTGMPIIRSDGIEIRILTLLRTRLQVNNNYITLVKLSIRISVIGYFLIKFLLITIFSNIFLSVNLQKLGHTLKSIN